jgi:hypothetical protein
MNLGSVLVLIASFPGLLFVAVMCAERLGRTTIALEDPATVAGAIAPVGATTSTWLGRSGVAWLVATITSVDWRVVTLGWTGAFLFWRPFLQLAFSRGY